MIKFIKVKVSTKDHSFESFKEISINVDDYSQTKNTNQYNRHFYPDKPNEQNINTTKFLFSDYITFIVIGVESEKGASIVELMRSRARLCSQMAPRSLGSFTHIAFWVNFHIVDRAKHVNVRENHPT